MTEPTLPDGLESLRIAAKGITLQAMAAGPADAPLLILLHGFPEFWYGWRRQIGSLAAAGLRVIAPDQRGYNLSDKPRETAAYRLDILARDVIGLADALGRERFAVVGHDWGATVAWQLAACHADRVSRAAMLNAPPLAVLKRYARTHLSQALKSWYIAYFQLPLLPELGMRAGGFRGLVRGLRRTSRPGTFTAEDLQHYRAAWAQPGALSAMLNWYRAARFSAALPPPDRIKVPVRVIWGDRDAFLEPGLAEASAALCDQAQVFHLPDASHWVQHEEAERVNRLLLDFLAV
jgi:pimeloyl-ACP methyl ester carboxylesterase